MASDKIKKTTNKTLTTAEIKKNILDKLKEQFPDANVNIRAINLSDEEDVPSEIGEQLLQAIKSKISKMKQQGSSEEPFNAEGAIEIGDHGVLIPLQLPEDLEEGLSGHGSHLNELVQEIPPEQYRLPSDQFDGRPGADQSEQEDAWMYPERPLEEILPEGAATAYLTDTVIFPNMVIPVELTRPQCVAAATWAQKKHQPLLLVAQRNNNVEKPSRRDLYSVGVLCHILHSNIKKDKASLLLEGGPRVRLRKTVSKKNDPFLKIIVSYLPEKDYPFYEGHAFLQAVLKKFRTYCKMYHINDANLLKRLQHLKNPGHMADIITSVLELPLDACQDLLETSDLCDRLEKVAIEINRRIDEHKISRKIEAKAKASIMKEQENYFLRAKLDAIRQEMGEEEEDEAKEAEQLKADILAAAMPEEAEKYALRELRKMTRMHPQSPDRSIVRTYLDWMLQVPWSKTTEDCLSLPRAERVLEEDHYGLQDVKDRILEFLAVRQLKKDNKGSILCLVGPPGVGKTSLGRSIARALGRKFNRTSLGGIHDEAEIRGHRRTYVGALPGRIIQALCKVGSLNPVIMLDEIDKVGKDYRGDPSAALLEALDPEQNHEFSDHYLSVPVDLSRTMFIMTANVTDTIPAPLRDRMEIIHLPGYTFEEKMQIGRRYLVPRQLEEHGLSDKQISISDEALESIIRLYTREAGVRNLEREIGKICRKRVRQIVGTTSADPDTDQDSSEEKTLPADDSYRNATQREKEAGAWASPEDCLEVNADKLPALLGVSKFEGKQKRTEGVPGCVNGLSWTQVGGQTLKIEAVIMPGKGKLQLTGNLGNVMKESAKAAITWVRSYLSEQGINFDCYKHDIHVHVPEGATPKDGPSAGITLATAIYSAITKKPVKQDLAMTGEITVTGQVTAVGGIKEKMLAAFNEDIFEIILSTENKKDLEEIPENIRQKMHFNFVDKASEVISLAFD